MHTHTHTDRHTHMRACIGRCPAMVQPCYRVVQQVVPSSTPAGAGAVQHFMPAGLTPLEQGSMQVRGGRAASRGGTQPACWRSTPACACCAVCMGGHATSTAMATPMCRGMGVPQLTPPNTHIRQCVNNLSNKQVSRVCAAGLANPWAANGGPQAVALSSPGASTTPTVAGAVHTPAPTCLHSLRPAQQQQQRATTSGAWGTFQRLRRSTRALIRLHKPQQCRQGVDIGHPSLQAPLGVTPPHPATCQRRPCSSSHPAVGHLPSTMCTAHAVC
jgi:hypothetical protein